MKVELHLLQNFPAANLNRDDMNEPKDCMFGGYRRARISSQCIKRATRKSPYFTSTAMRTKRGVQEITQRLTSKGWPESDANAVALGFVEQLVGKVDEKGESDVLFFAGIDELDEIANQINELNRGEVVGAVNAIRETKEDENKAKEEETKAKAEAGAAKKSADKSEQKKANDRLKSATATVKEKGEALVEARRKFGTISKVNDWIKRHKGSVQSVDIALFGRMLASKPELNIDAACQVAHAISTNEVKMEFDYYTAIDEIKERDGEQGAAMIGFIGFNSSCFYRYLLIDVDKLYERLRIDQNADADKQSGDHDPKKDVALEGIRAFLEAASTAIPTGKQNNFAAQTPTVLAFGVVRENGMPMSLANAFEQPVRPHDSSSLVAESIARLSAHWNALARMYPRNAATGYVTVLEGMGTLGEMTGDVNTVDSLDEMIEGVMMTLNSGWNPKMGEQP